ncbi:MAG: TspO/MBR family protein [Pyrinomonadaceae bacterium]
MPELQVQANQSDRLRAVLVLIATLATIAFNFMAAMGGVNNVTPATISDKYPTVLTPAGYAFSIWSLIYLGMIAFSVYQLFPSNFERLRRLRTLYIVSCVLNCAWIYVWHYDQIAMSMVVILLLLGSLFLIVNHLRDFDSTADIWLLHAPFGIYFGWVTAASLVNFLVLLAYLKVEFTSSMGQFVGSALILVATLAAVAVRLKLSNYFFPLAVAWALTAIAVKQSGQTGIVVSAALGVVICLVTTGSIVTTLKDATSE